MKETQSFQLDEWTRKMIDDVSDRLFISRDEVVELAMQAMIQFGVARQLERCDAAAGIHNGYSMIISRVNYKSDIEDKMRNSFDCAFRATD